LEDLGLIRGGIRVASYSTRDATVPAGTVHDQDCGGGYGWRGARNASRGASPMAGKREGFSF
jgi:hypothetical protein